MRRFLPYLLGICLAFPALAEAPDASLRPLQRPGTGTAPESPSDPVVTPSGPVVVTVRASEVAPGSSLRPRPRPGISDQVTPLPVEAIAALLPEEPATEAEAAQEPRRPRPGLLAMLTGHGRRINPEGVTAVPFSLRPLTRPDGLQARAQAAATRATPARVTQPGRRGQLCGRRGIVGDRLERIPGRISGCGIADPVRVREIDGIALSQPATINCDAARATQDWLNDTVIPEVGNLGGGVSSLRVVASYSCRTRNNRPGARLSEHSTGNAIDIAAIGLVNGTELSVLSDWGGGRRGRILRSLHEGACGTFGTVLGPNSDRYHQDHFHFDVASYRSGPYCR